MVLGSSAFSSAWRQLARAAERRKRPHRSACRRWWRWWRSRPEGPVGTSLVGTYSATLALPACTGLPDADRVRRYSARVIAMRARCPRGHTEWRDVPRQPPIAIPPGADDPQSVPRLPRRWRRVLHALGRLGILVRRPHHRADIVRPVDRRPGAADGRLGSRAITASGAGAVYYCAATTTAFQCEGGNWVTCSTTLTLTLVPE